MYNDTDTYHTSTYLRRFKYAIFIPLCLVNLPVVFFNLRGRQGTKVKKRYSKPWRGNVDKLVELPASTPPSK